MHQQHIFGKRGGKISGGVWRWTHPDADCVDVACAIGCVDRPALAAIVPFYGVFDRVGTLQPGEALRPR